MLSILSETEGISTQLVENALPSVENVMIIQQQPVMESAIDVLTNVGKFGRVVLKARGDSIPFAVAVANIVTKNLMKGNSEIAEITVDSENNSEKFGMTLVSTIQIIIAKK